MKLSNTSLKRTLLSGLMLKKTQIQYDDPFPRIFSLYNFINNHYTPVFCTYCTHDHTKFIVFEHFLDHHHSQLQIDPGVREEMCLKQYICG